MSEFQFFSFNNFHMNSSRQSEPLSSHQQPTKRTTSEEISHELNVPYTIFEILVAIVAIIGNLMVIIVFQKDRKLRRRTNYYIVSLAIADFLVGLLGVPFAILASIGLPTNLHACLFTVSLLVVLCTISIFCLVAVSVDRYWAILYPMAYSRNVRTKTAIVIISMCWVAGTIVGFLPLFGWHADVGPKQACLFVEVMDYSYLVFLYFATIITPALLMLAFYAHIYRVIVKQVRQIVTMKPVGDGGRCSSPIRVQITPVRLCHGGTMLRVLGAARKRDVKATQNLSIIVLFFMICWIPLYTINCIKAFCPDCYVHPKLTFFCIILSHLNSAVNPILYAYHLKDFRAALKNLILKMFGAEVDPPHNPMHRFSLASQHRLQTIENKRSSSLQAKIYIDSPIWLRQQQQLAMKTTQSRNVEASDLAAPKYGEGCRAGLSSVHQTVTAVASSATNINQHEMWNILETPKANESESGGEILCYQNNKHHQFTIIAKDDHDSSFSYENHTYNNSSPDDFEYDEVFLNNNGNLDERRIFKKPITLPLTKHEKHYSDGDYHNMQRFLSESSLSGSYELSSSTKGHLILTSFSETIVPNHCHHMKEVSRLLSLKRKFSLSIPSIDQSKIDKNDINFLSITNQMIMKKSSHEMFSSFGREEQNQQSFDDHISRDSNGSIVEIITNNNSNNFNIFDHPSTNEMESIKTMTDLILTPSLIKHSSLFHIITAGSNDTNKDSAKTDISNEQIIN